VTLTASTQVQAFSAAGVQAGDGVEISDGVRPEHADQLHASTA
jgi:hypothetical protein